MRALHGNPWDGHTLTETLEQVSILTEKTPKIAVVKGYRGVEIEGIQILRSGPRRGITKSLRALIYRCSAIDLVIGHMKSDGRLQRSKVSWAMRYMLCCAVPVKTFAGCSSSCGCFVPKLYAGWLIYMGLNRAAHSR